MKVKIKKNKILIIPDGFTVLEVFVNDIIIHFIQEGNEVELETPLAKDQKVVVYYDAGEFKGYHGFTVK